MKSIRSKLWAGMMTLILIVLVLLWLFQIVFLESFYTNMRISNVRDEAISIVKVLESGNTSEFENKLDAFSYKNNLDAELVDSSGNSIYITGTSGYGSQMPMMMSGMRVDVYEKALKGDASTETVTHPRFGIKFMLIGLPVKTSGVVSEVLIVNMSLAPVEDTTSILKLQLFYITLILLAASLIISFIISRGFTKPILEIKKASERMASGDFSARIATKKQDEIGKLADTINYLGQQLSKIDQLRKELIANVSHELRTPLSLIRGYAETLRDVTGNVPEKREKQLGIIVEESERLSRMVDDILNLSQLQSGYITLNKSKFPVKEVLDTVLKPYDVLSEKRGIKIIKECKSDGFLEGDEDRIKQVFYNLINNAFNHTPEGGTITISAIDLNEKVRFEISDTGSGIELEEIPYIWDRYYKSDKRRNKDIVGTGLGLAIVKEILSAHEAVFDVESEKNIGTTFWFEIKKS